MNAQTKYETHTANAQAIADAWMEENAHLLEAEISVGDDTGCGISNPRPASDKALHTITLSGNDIVTERQMVKATESTYATSEDPSDSLAGVDPESLGFYVCSRKQSDIAKRERATFGIAELVLSKSSKRSVGTPRLRRPRRSLAERAAAIAARRNK